MNRPEASAGRKDQAKLVRESRLSRFFMALAWLATTACGSIAILRFCFHDGTHLLIWLNAFTRYVYLPAYLCLIFACVRRHWWLATANLAIIGCHVYWLAPDFLRDRRFEPSAAAISAAEDDVNRLRIFFANVRAENREHAALLREIQDAQPDVIVLVELSQNWNTGFRQSPLVTEFPYGSGLEVTQANSVSILSKVPLKNDVREWFAGRCVETVEVQVGSQTLRLVGLHAPRPMSYRDNDYEGYWRNVLPLLIGKPHPLVIVGDFNATQHSLVYHELKAVGLRSAHDDRGRGYATTWPNGREWIPAIRIDQAFVSSEVECLDILEGVGFGSDHKPLVLDIEIR
jgi:endonuclease/exonuclease/phosphatase (EEP) superfamily protein YafD